MSGLASSTLKFAASSLLWSYFDNIYLAAGSNYYVRILSTLNRELLKPSSSVALHRHSNALVDILPPEADSSISLLSDAEKPNVKYSVIVSSAFEATRLTQTRIAQEFALPPT